MEFSTQRNNNLLTLEYLEDGSRSPIVSQSPRELFARVTHLTSSFASTAALATSDGLQGKLLHMRDVRKLQMPFSAQNQPAVIVRRLAILLNFDPLRTIVLHDRLIVLVPDGADSVLDKLHTLLHRADDIASTSTTTTGSVAGVAAMVQDDPCASTFPFRAVEAVMSTVLSNLDTDLQQLSVRTREGLKRLEDRTAVVSIEALENMRSLKNSVAAQEARAQNAKRAISDLLDEDEDMALMNFVQPLPRTPSLDALMAAAAHGGGGTDGGSSGNAQQRQQQQQPPTNPPVNTMANVGGDALPPPAPTAPHPPPSTAAVLKRVVELPQPHRRCPVRVTLCVLHVP